MGRVWGRTIDIIARGGSALAILVMMSLIVVEVMGRKFFAFSIVGTVELVSSLVVVSGLLAWAYTESQNRHVKVEFVVERLPSNTRLVLDVITTLVMLGVLAVMLWQTTVYALEALHPFKTFESVKMPVFPFRLIVPVGIFFFSLDSLVKLMRKLIRLASFSRNRLSNTG